MVETCTWLTILNFIPNAKDVCMSKFNPLEGGPFGGGHMILEEHNPLDITMVLEEQASPFGGGGVLGGVGFFGGDGLGGRVFF